MRRGKLLTRKDHRTRFELLANIELTPVIEDDAFNLEQDHISVPYQISS
jgi:hypothetical protein